MFSDKKWTIHDNMTTFSPAEALQVLIYKCKFMWTGEYDFTDIKNNVL